MTVELLTMLFIVLTAGIAACHVSGDPHFYTFDKVMHTFMGTCTYMLVDVCDMRSITPFTIKGKTEDRGQRAATYLKEVYIDIYGIHITLQRDRRTLVRLNTRQIHKIPRDCDCHIA